MAILQSKGAKVATCIFCTPVSFFIPCCIDEWWSMEACLLSYLNCGRCCWTICSPICFSCDIGNFKDGVDYFVEAIKYFFYAFALSIVGIFDGFWNCGNFIVECVKDGANSFTKSVSRMLTSSPTSSKRR